MVCSRVKFTFTFTFSGIQQHHLRLLIAQSQNKLTPLLPVAATTSYSWSWRTSCRSAPWALHMRGWDSNSGEARASASARSGSWRTSSQRDGWVPSYEVIAVTWYFILLSSEHSQDKNAEDSTTLGLANAQTCNIYYDLLWLFCDRNCFFW